MYKNEQTNKTKNHKNERDNTVINKEGRTENNIRDEAQKGNNPSNSGTKNVRGKGNKKHESMPKKRTRKMLPVPPYGEPGAWDDPRRKGLSGAGTKWYLRFLAQGKAPDEARKLAEDRKIGRKEQSTTRGETQGGKRGRESLTPPEETVKRRRIVGGRAMGHHTIAHKSATQAIASTSYANAVKTVRVAVLPKEYPEVKLSSTDLTTLEEAIIDEVALGWKVSLRFEGIHFRPGMLLIDCANEETSRWLMESTSRLSEWKGVPLMARKGEDIPKPHVITTYLPRSAGQAAKKLLAIIQAQNKETCTDVWKILRAKEEGNGQLLTVEIDSTSAAVIAEDGHTLGYRFGKVAVHGLRRQPAKEDVPELEAGGKEGNLPTLKERKEEDNPPARTSSQSTREMEEELERTLLEGGSSSLQEETELGADDPNSPPNQ